MVLEDGQINKKGATTNTLVRFTISEIVLDIPMAIGNQVIEANYFNAGTTIAVVADMNGLLNALSKQEYLMVLTFKYCRFKRKR